jgi:signal transduction histidine kinase
MVSLIMHEEDILRGYYTNRYYYFIFLGVFIGFTITIGVFSIVLVGQIRRAQLSEQNALLASQAKSDFLAKISHELRTPLNAIIGFSEMLEAEYFGKLAVDQRERIHDIHECGSHLLALINDLLDFSKAEAGKLVLNEENIYLGDVISEALRMVSPQASHAGVTIIDQTATCLPTLRADARKLKQVLVNLLSNSIKFTPKRGNITVSTMITKRGDLQIMVQDTGIGMDENQIPKAFSLFEQVHNDSGQGTGLGLSLCKMLVELHDGRIGMRSKKGEGTSVFFLIPKKRLTDPALNKRGFFS